jgi:hypothetical protein
VWDLGSSNPPGGATRGSAEAPESLAWRGVAWLMLSAGCAPTSPGVDPEVAALVRALQAPERDPDAATAFESVHDLGPVLARGQTIRHDFTLRNPSDRPLRIVGAEALVPCCSAVGPLPESVPPHGEIAVPVVFKPGFQSGRKQVGFVVKTDDTLRPVRPFTFLAFLIPETEVHVLDGSDRAVSVGSAGQQTLRIVCRRIGKQGRGIPITVRASTPVQVKFAGTEIERALPDGTIELTRTLTVDLPALDSAGLMRSDVVFDWPDGFSKTYQVKWKVSPRIQSIPAATVILPGPPSKHYFIIKSEDKAFRITKLTGGDARLLGTLPTLPERHHKICLEIDPQKLPRGKAVDIEVETDNPAQPRVVLSVLVTGSPSGGKQ